MNRQLLIELFNSYIILQIKRNSEKKPRQLTKSTQSLNTIKSNIYNSYFNPQLSNHVNNILIN